MAISLVNFSGGGQTAGPFTTVVSAGQSVANGNTIVVGIRWSAQSVTDNAGNSYVALPHLPGSGGATGEGLQFFYCNNCVGNPSLVVTATLVSSSLAADTYTGICVWNISGGPLTLDQYFINTGGSGSTMTYTPVNTSYQNSIVCLIGMSTAALTTYTVNAPLVQDGGTSIAGLQIMGASHVIYTTMQSAQSLVSTGTNGSWQIGGPIFGIARTSPSSPIQKKRKSVGAALFTGREYNYYITLERLF
jgi:hypothetical protein